MGDGDGDDSRQGTPHTSQSEETRVWQRRSQQNYDFKLDGNKILRKLK